MVLKSKSIHHLKILTSLIGSEHTHVCAIFKIYMLMFSLNDVSPLHILQTFQSGYMALYLCLLDQMAYLVLVAIMFFFY